MFYEVEPLSQSRVFSFSVRVFILCALTASGTWLHAGDVWNSPAFSVEPAALRAAANAISAAKDTGATMLLNEMRYSFDAQGRTLRTTHTIFRVETQEAVEDWSEVRESWQPWYQAAPEIRARVITADGAVHMLDAKTLSDVPENEDSPDTFSDNRAFGGPLPAIAAGAIVEEEIVLRDKGVFFAAGDNTRLFLNRSIPVSRSRIILEHPETFPIRYETHLLPDAKIAKAVSGGVETITIENGPLEAVTDRTGFAPPELAVRPQVEISTGHSWKEVASEYARQSEAKLRVSDVQPVLARLGLKAGSNLDAVGKIVSYLHNTVRYTGVEFGEASLVPQFPAETLKRKYGDCKDKAALLIAMLRAAGIPASMALLSAGPGQDVNPEMSGMGMFDHAIVYAPATDSSPELWIDATAQYNTVGSLPGGDYDRWALIVDSATTALRKTPALTSAQNVHRELRAVTMAEFGPAKFVERNEQTGQREMNYREFHSGDPKKLRENLENYFKDAYVAESGPTIEKNDPADLQKPFVVTFAGQGKRGFTYLNEAIVYIADGSIFGELPGYFTVQEPVEKEKEGEGDKKSPRTLDWAIEPSLTEWRYKIAAPLGFKVRALPSDQDVTMGPGHLTEKFSASADGALVEAVLRFDSGKSRFTAEEGRQMRDAIVKHLAADLPAITFDHIGHALLVEGRTREALDAYRSLTVQHPKEALHRVQMANALLNAGLAERARVVAREATVLDPRSAQAFNMLGWALQHDLIGRNLQAGFDYERALDAYRRAKQLDPKNQDYRANLATLLEYDAEGIRYSDKAHLKEALAEFREFKGLDEEFGRKYDDFILYDLFYTGQYKELREAVSALPGSETRKGLLLAAVASTDGVDAAVKKSLEITTGSAEKGTALINAGWLMLRRLRYHEAVELLAAGSSGQSTESKVAPLVAILRKLPRHEDVRIDDSAPSGVLLQLLDLVFRGAVDENRIREIFSTLAQTQPDEFNKKELLQGRAALRAAAESASMPLEALADITLTGAHFVSEGDDRLGYKIAIEAIGAATQHAYVLREAGRYKIVSFLGGTTTVPENIGWVVTARLEAHDLEGARKWLDWAREDVHSNKGDDPLSGQPFPGFWVKGQQGDEAAARRAALVLVPSKELIGSHLTALVGFRDQAASQGERNSLNVVLAYAYRAQRRWSELAAVAQELMKAEPDSMVAFNFDTAAYAEMKDFGSWEKLVQARREKHPDDPDYIRNAARLYRYRGEIAKERELLKGLIDRGKATPGDLNWYSWEALFLPQAVGQESIDAAQRASDLTKRSDFGILHTLACLYAEQGKTAKARELLLQAMQSNKMPEPDSAIWLGFGMIAEQYGEIEAAKTMYGRVEKMKEEVPGSNYSVAQAHLEKLSNAKR